MIKKTSTNKIRKIRHNRMNKRIKGDAERPRLCVYRSLKNLYIQVINDTEDKSLFGVSMLSKSFKEKVTKPGLNKENVIILGKMVAEECSKHGIKSVVFDRNGFKYHGRIEALANAIREAGISF